MKENFGSSVILTKLALRRERVNSTAWVIITAVFMAFVMYLFAGMMSEEARLEMGVVIENPAMVAMVGPAYGMPDNYTMGAIYTNMMLVFTALAIIVMNIMLVVRHTRADEEKGRYEVVRSLPTGRIANLNAAMITAVIVNVVLAVAVALSLIITGDESVTLNGSLLWGALLGSVGLVFAAIAALFSQLSSGSRGAMGYSFMTVGVFYMMRAIGDVSAEALSLISPIGLISRSQAYVENYWWPVPILLAVSIIISAIAYWLNAKRDIDQGLLPDKKGKSEAGKLLRTPFGLSLKLLKTPIIVGVLTIFAIGSSYGVIMNDISGFIETNEFYQQLMMLPEDIGGISESELLMAFLGMIVFIMSLMSLIPVLLYITKARGEEKEIRTELILATPVKRTNYLGGYVLIAFIASIVLQFLTGFGLWISGTSVLDNPEILPFSDIIIANLAYLPALWIVLGLAVFLIGFAPKYTNFIWAIYGYVFIMAFFGRLPVFPDWFPQLGPYGYLPTSPVDEINILNLIYLTVIAAGFTFMGFTFYKNRDINAITH